MQDISCASDPERSAPRAALLAAVTDRLGAVLRQVRGEVAWGPLAARALATAVALVGLAGIGLAASRSPELAVLTRAPVSTGLAQLGGTELRAALGVGGAAAAAQLTAGAAGRTAVDDATANGATTTLAPAAKAAEAPLPCGTPAQEAAVEPEPGNSATAGAARASPGPAGSRHKGVGLVSLNRADASEFQRLPGVGAKRALAIVALRQRLGRFRRPSDLLRVKGIGPKTLERMLPQLVLDAAP